MKKISALLIICNDGNVVKKCLDSIKDVVDDIVVVHDGECVDNTLKIVSKYTSKIFVEKKVCNPEFLKVKYFNLNKNKKLFNHSFVLSIDADEYLTAILAKEIASLKLDRDGYYFIRRSTGQNNKKERPLLRLFRVAKIKLFGFYHQDFVLLNKNSKLLKGELIHDHKSKGKSIDWLSLEAKGLKNKSYNYYNFSVISRVKNELFLYLRTKIFLRKLYRSFLFKKYKSKYGLAKAKAKLEYFDTLTKKILKS